MVEKQDTMNNEFQMEAVPGKKLEEYVTVLALETDTTMGMWTESESFSTPKRVSHRIGLNMRGSSLLPEDFRF